MSQMQDKSYGIKPRYSPDPDQDLIADIVFVHGLTGSADSTWAAEKMAYTGLRSFFVRISLMSAYLPSDMTRM